MVSSFSVTWQKRWKSPEAVIPAQAGVHNAFKQLDPRLRGDDERITKVKTRFESSSGSPTSIGTWNRIDRRP
jgi:hypothetical protein